MIEFGGQRVRAQTEFHQRFGFRQTRSGEPMVRLIVLHRFMRARVPLAACITLKVALANQRLLDFLNALRLQVKARQSLLAAERAGPPMARGRAFVQGSGGGGASGRRFRGRS